MDFRDLFQWERFIAPSIWYLGSRSVCAASASPASSRVADGARPLAGCSGSSPAVGVVMA